MPVGGGQHIQLQQQLGPLGLVPDLKTPRPEDVGAVVAVVVPVDRPVTVKVLQDPPLAALSERGLALADTQGQLLGTQQVTRLARGAKRGHQCLTGMHVGVLPAIVRQAPLRRGLIGIQPRRWLPEMAFSRVKRFGQPLPCFAQARFTGARIRQHDKRHAVAMPCGVQHCRPPLVPVDQPCIPTGGGVEKCGAQEPHCMRHALAVGLIASQLPQQGMGDHEPRGADQVTRALVIDRAIVQKKSGTCHRTGRWPRGHKTPWSGGCGHARSRANENRAAMRSWAGLSPSKRQRALSRAKASLQFQTTPVNGCVRTAQIRCRAGVPASPP